MTCRKFNQFILVGALLTMASATSTEVLAQQISSDPSLPIQYVSAAQFNQLVQNGKLMPETPGVIFDQIVQHVLTDLKNRAVIDAFIAQNPNLPNFAQLAHLTPTNPAVHRTANGNYSTVITLANGDSQPIELSGESVKMAEMANTISTSSDPVHEASLYQFLFSQYSTAYTQLCITSLPPIGSTDLGSAGFPILSAGCANLTAPSALTDPAALQNAPLATIKMAIQSLASQGIGLVDITPPPAPNIPVACMDEVGASTTLGVDDTSSNNRFGDQTGGQTTLSPHGILANFNFPDKKNLTCVKNQGHRGTCHIFVAMSAIEAAIAQNSGVKMNLSEQDFNENLKLFWAPDDYIDGGYPEHDLQLAAAAGYQFAYENQWDYNPSLAANTNAPGIVEYFNSCVGYPSSEPGCSDSAPQAPQYCTTAPTFQCGFGFALLPGSNSPYISQGATSFWEPVFPDISIDIMKWLLSSQNQVILSFMATTDYIGNSFPPGYANAGYLPYSPQDIANPAGAHSVHVVAYIDNSVLANNPNTPVHPGSGGGYFVVKNSYGALWGDAGYAYLPVDYVKATALSAAVVSAPLQLISLSQ